MSTTTRTASRIGFIGLGTMGKGMASNILKAGYPLVVHDIDPIAVREMATRGAAVADEIAHLGPRCDVIILCLPDTSIVEQVLWDSGGLVESLPRGQIVIDCGTTHPLATRTIHERCQDQGLRFLDAPVSGMSERAAEGTLTIMVGGDEALFQEVRPLLETMGTTIVYMGGPGSGQLTKVLNNVFFNISCAAVAELLPLAVKMGLDPSRIVDVAGSGTGQSFALNYFGPLILKGNFGPGYPMAKAYKDMVAIVEVMNTFQIPAPVTMATFLTYQIALNEGLGDCNKGGMVRVWEDILRVHVRSGEKPSS